MGVVYSPRLFVLLVALVPTAVAFGLLRYFQRDNVSWPLLLENFWLGVVGALPIALLEAGIAWLTIRHWERSNDIGVLFVVATLNAFLIAALCEESFKYLCVSRVVQDERQENCWQRHPHKHTIYMSTHMHS